MRFLKSSTGILTVVVALVAAYVYFFEYKKSETEKVAKAEASKLFQTTESDVVSLRLKWAGGETLLSKNEKGEWFLDAPVKDSVDIAAVNAILKNISEDVSEDIVTSDPNVDLAIFGLKDPLGTITITKRDNSIQTVSFGQVDALEGKKYALLSLSKTVVLVQSFTQTRYVKTAKDFRSKKIQQTPRADISAFTVRIPNKNIVVSMIKDNGVWKYSGHDWEVDAQAVESFLVQLNGLNTTDFVSENKKSAESKTKYMTNSALAVFDLKTKDGAVESITAHGVREGQVFITSSLKDTVYQVQKATYEAFLIGVDQFRNKKRAFEFNKDAVENIEIKTSLLKMTLKKEGSDWKVLALPDNKVVDQSQIKKLIDELSELSVVHFLGEDKKKSLVNPQGSIVLKSKAGAVEFELKWGADVSEKERMAFTNKSNEALSVSKSNIAMLPLQTIVQDKKTEMPKPEDIDLKKSRDNEN